MGRKLHPNALKAVPAAQPSNDLGHEPSPGFSALVVDPDAEARAAVRDLLVRIGLPVLEVADGETALAAAEAAPPQLVILEVRLPGLGGYETCRELRERFGDQVVIVFVSGDRTEPSDRTAGLLLGADDYLAKPLHADELLARIRSLLRRRAGSERPFEELTPREMEVLKFLASGLTQEEIATTLVLSTRTVGTHIQHILGKLSVHSRAQAVALAHRHKLLPG
jgi:DNA-binding NarL/FixJ family response regulator